MQKYPSTTTLIAAGWTDPTNGYTFNNQLTYAETDLAEQEYDGYGFDVTQIGTGTIDKVLALIKYTTSLTKIGAGDSSTVICYIRIYNGSSWQNYQVTSETYVNNTPLVDEQPTITTGDTSNAIVAIDVTSFLDTLAKISSAKARLLFNITATSAGVTPRWSVDCISLIVCYSPSSAGAAILKRELPSKAKKALETLVEVLSINT